ncbi:DUF4124 domain-containing protein [Jeongeupia naejangsanensis]|uniref:DUF4124 domain-containing protein n=1 Tax=Jeongeupia naejangsanensis TaxID=613195 RepID=A0ABS2BFI4_9NEIS|nr:DUF4124 domain-containing protein [Jeongeupia naejangsanensis]MBM3114369.1 DUF4124 domain-containing protein [Jeongeupia naejangsanensis]
MKLHLALLALCMATGVAHAEIYKWKDASGNWQYSDTPPAGADKGKAQVVKTAKQPVTVAPAAAAKASAPAAASAPQQAAPQAKDDSKKDPKVCAEARKRLGYLQTSRYNSLNEKGKVEFMTEERKKEEITATQEVIKEACG